MAEQSGPLSGEVFTDSMWRAIHGDEPAIVGDVNGSSYALTLSTSSNDASLGSASQDSVSVVGGFMHRIPAGESASVEIPEAVGASRTDLITVRYDPTFTTAPGPCRLHRIAGAPGGTQPTFDAGPPGVEDMPLYAVTRTPGQSLAQATVRSLRTWRGPQLNGAHVDVLKGAFPLGTSVLIDGVTRSRVLGSNGSPTWRAVGSRVRLAAAGSPLVGPALPTSALETTDVRIITEYIVLTTNPSRLVTWNLPGGGFPNGILYTSAEVLTIGTDGFPAGFRAVPWGPTGLAPTSRTRVRLQIFTASGQMVPANNHVVLSAMAIGW